ncbi:MAG: host attachment protein [Gammaproteobacteria bacterium]|nr:host attachment protein [Gammaproteobacteria bacterium]
MVRPNMPLEAHSYRVVVADEFRAIFYDRDKKFSPLREKCTMQNDAAREKLGDLISDKGGRSFDSNGPGRHTMAIEKDDPKTHSAVVFAKDIAERLVMDRSRGGFDQLIVVAAPRFLGVLRPALATAGIEAERELAKEVTARDADFIQKLVDSA